MMKIARRFTFQAAHRLPHHDGKCHRLHGHAYQLELVFGGSPRPVRPDDPQSGFVADFGLIDDLVRQELIDPYLDHHLLDERIPELGYSSAEHLAAWIVGWCVRHLEGRPELGNARLLHARVWETANAWAEAEREDAVALGFLPGSGP